jgi:hypothetical protein
MKMKLEIKINIRQNILLGLVFLATMLFSCTVTQEINGFGGGFRTFKDKIEAQKNVPQKQETKTLANNEKTETLEVIYKDFENSNSTEKVEVNATTNPKLTNLKKAITTPTLTKLPKTNSLKQKIISKLIQIKLKHSKSKTKQSSSNGFIPDKNSDFGYWFLFVLFCMLSIIGTIFLLSTFVSTGWDFIGYAAGAIIFLPFALIHYIGLKNYAQLDECGFLYQFGFWTSMFAWWFFGIPLLIWLIGALTCGS